MAESKVACPNDTNGDGDCGRKWCPYCGKNPLGEKVVDETTAGEGTARKVPEQTKEKS